MYINIHKYFTKVKKNVKYWNKMTYNYILRVTPRILEYFEIMDSME